MKAKLAIAAGIIVLLLILAGIGWRIYNKPHRGVSDTATDVRITATSLFQAFQQDELLANKKFLNKVIEVTGNVSGVQKLNGSEIIFLTAYEDLGGISCRLSTNEKHNGIGRKKGAALTLKGRCSGFLLDVNLVDCIIK